MVLIQTGGGGGSSTDTLMILSGSTQNYNVTSTRYNSITERITNNGAEENFEVAIAKDCNIDRLSIQIRLNTKTTSCTGTLRKNQTDTELAITFGAGLTGTFTDTGSVDYEIGDTINMKYESSDTDNCIQAGITLGGTFS